MSANTLRYYIMFALCSFSSEAVGDGIAEARDPDACKSHLELDELGRVLEAISKHSPGIHTLHRVTSY